MDYSGCGNTLNCNHPITEKLIVECLEFWVREMHVDGFRFDEGSILARGQNGEVLAYPPVIWDIELSETLADTQDHRRGLGRRRPVPDRLLPGLPLGRVERQVPRRHPPLPARATAAWSAPWPTASPAPPDLYQTLGAPADQQHQLHQLPRRLHAERHRLATTRSTTGTTARATTTASTTTCRGTAASRGRPTIRRSRRSATGRSRTLRDADAVARRPDVRGRRRDPPHAARQQQRLLPGQRDQLVRLVAAGQARRRAAVLPADDRVPQAA